MVIAIDFDGTLVHQTDFPCLQYKLKDHAEETIRYLAKNHTLVLNSARYGWYRLPAIIFIKQCKLPIKTHIFNKKEPADLYIDDRNFPVTNFSWLEVLNYFKNLEEEKHVLHK